MAKRVVVPCSLCNIPISLDNRSLQRYFRKSGKGEYVCFACTQGINKSKITPEERQRRSERSKALWANQEYRDKVNEAIRNATSTEEFKQIVSDNNKERWRDPEFRAKMDAIMNDPEFAQMMSDKIKNKD